MGLEEYMKEKKKIIEAFMDKVLGAEFISNEKLRAAMRHTTMAGGKRLRPIYVYLVAESIKKGSGPLTLPVGCAMELVHNFTLVHDDIMDNADKRHGVTSVHVAYDINTAINAGDTLFARAFEILCQGHYEDKKTVRIIGEMSRMIIKIAEGQQMDLDFEKMSPDDVTEEDYIAMVENKTARMFQYGARFASILNDCDNKTIDKLGEMGRLLGIGFQIWDDVLDLTAPEETLGKPRGGDIKEGKKTLIVIKARKKMAQDKWSEFMGWFGCADVSQEEIERAIKYLEKCGAIDYARIIAENYVNRAFEILESELVDSEERAMLKALITYLITRKL